MIITFPLLLFSPSIVSNSLATPWTVACQAPLSMGFPRQEYWTGLPFPSPGDLHDPGTEPTIGRGFLYHWAASEAHYWGSFTILLFYFVVITLHISTPASFQKWLKMGKILWIMFFGKDLISKFRLLGVWWMTVSKLPRFMVKLF